MSLRKILAGAVMLVFTIFVPMTAEAGTTDFQPDGVMGQSLYEEQMPAGYRLPSIAGTSQYTQSFRENSFTTKGKYTGKTYYHKAGYEALTLLNGIDVSWWQCKVYKESDPNYRKVTGINWEKAHDDGIDFAFVRVASSDTKGGTIYTDTSADSHIQGALENDINVGLYIFSQAMTEKKAVEEARYVLNLLDQYGWDVTLPIVMDREPGRQGPLKAGKLTKAKETAVEQAFIDTIVDAGYQAAVYANYHWFRNYIDGNQLRNSQIWFARYNNTTTSNATKGVAYADIPVEYDFWQYTSSNVSMAGWSSSSLDMNFWYKDTSIKTEGLEIVKEADGSVKLTWDEAAEDVTGYRVYRYDPDRGKYIRVASTSGCSYKDTKVESGKDYLYKVRCYWTLGGKNYYGTYSDELGTGLSIGKVTGLRTEKQSSTYITLAWDAVQGADGYRIYQYDSDAKKFVKIKDITAENTSFKVEKLTSAKDYRFNVLAFIDDSNGRHLGSSSKEHAESTKPLKVRKLKAVPSSENITLSWKAVSRATGYQVYRLDLTTGKYVKIATVLGENVTSYTDTGVTNGTSYTYKVRAYRKRTGKTDFGVFSDVFECVLE